MCLDFNLFKPWLLEVFSLRGMEDELKFGDGYRAGRSVLFGYHPNESPLLAVATSQRAGRKTIDGCDKRGEQVISHYACPCLAVFWVGQGSGLSQDWFVEGQWLWQPHLEASLKAAIVPRLLAICPSQGHV